MSPFVNTTDILECYLDHRFLKKHKDHLKHLHSDYIQSGTHSQLEREALEQIWLYGLPSLTNFTTGDSPFDPSWYSKNENGFIYLPGNYNKDAKGLIEIISQKCYLFIK